MGLDQYARVIEKDAAEDAKGVELAYWRKHNRLQGWMEKLYKGKGGEEEFNCVDVELTLGDLDELEAAINDKSLPETGGFFFGQDSYEDYDSEYGYKSVDMEFIENARKELNSGNRVVYSSWW